MLVSGLVVGYWVLLFSLWQINFQAGKQQQNLPPGKENPLVSVCVAYRNEASHLPDLIQSLEKQDYAPKYWELILVNDHSDDSGPDWVEKYISSVSFSIRSYHLPHEKTGKKEAISMAISESNGEFIIGTDADCTMSPEWISRMVQLITVQNQDLVCGPVCIRAEGFWNSFQSLEFSSLVAVASAGIHLQKPNFCNAANLIFRKSAFIEMQEKRLDMGLPGGDDVFFMHQLHKQNKPIGFCMDPGARVITGGQKGWKNFENQRIRWASKTKAGLPGANLGLASIIWLFHGLFLVWLALGWWQDESDFLLILNAKILAETIFLLPFQWKKNGVKLLLMVMVSQLFYSLYVLYFGVRILVSSRFQWKGRQF